MCEADKIGKKGVWAGEECNERLYHISKGMQNDDD